MPSLRAVTRSLCACLLLAGCTGVITRASPGESESAAGASSASEIGPDGKPIATPGGAGDGGSGNVPNADPSDTPGTEGTDPGRKAIHRLNSAEYNATVRDVLGTSLAPATASWRGGEDHGFDNIADVLGVDEVQYGRYLEAAVAVAEDVFRSEPTRIRIVNCDQADDAVCVRGVIQATGRRVLRRPLDADQIATYRGVYDRARDLGESHDGSLQQVLTAMLASAEFLYRIESDPDPNSLEPHTLEPFDLASRLSYFLWSSAPDDVLLDAAADRSLLESSVLQVTVDRMLDDPKSDRLIEHFAGQWLGARRVPEHAVARDVFPDWDPAVAPAMAEEMYRYFEEFVRNERPYREFLTADVNFVNGSLARHYDLPDPGAGTVRVEATGDARAGFLGLGGFLALSSYEYRTAPTLRGRWVLINLLCSPPGDPPPGVPALDEAPGSVDSAEQNVRERLARHRTDPICASCHSAMDPYGLALENFDATGRYRAAYRDGSPVDASTSLPDGTAFDGLGELAEVVSDDPRFMGCAVEKLFTYALGRGVEKTDRPYLASIEESWLGQAPTFRRLIQAIAASEPFRSRRGESERGSP